MPAYMIITATVHDREAFLRDYAPRAAALVTRFGGRYVLRAPGARTLEGSGASGASVVISEWHDTAAALAFWNSPEYAAVKRLREDLADCEVMLVEAAAIMGAD